ncbi:MAG TPA: hypothetical protein VF341_07375, partial [Anaeromyxobacteraceae bacterium]
TTAWGGRRNRAGAIPAAAVVSEPGPRIAVIEELDVAKRLDLVSGEVASVILMLSRGRTPSA